MPQLPTYTRQLLPSGIPQGPRETGQSGLAQGLEAIEQATAQVGQDVAAIEDNRQRKKDEADTVWAAKTAAQARLDWTQKAITAEESAEAGAPNFKGNLEKSYDEATAEILKQAPSPKAGDYLSLRMSELKTALMSDAMRFEAGSRVDKRIADSRETINISRNTVSTDYRQFDAVLGDVTTAIGAMDVPPTKKQALLNEARQGIAFSAVAGQSNVDPAGTLADLNAGKWDSYLDADAKGQLARAAESELKRREVEAKQRAAEAKAQYLTGFDDYVSAVASGYAKPDGRYGNVGKVIGGEDGARLQKQIDIAQETGSLVAQINTATPEELVAIEAKQRADLSKTENFRLEASQANTVAQLIDQRNKALVGDPAAYTLQNAPNVKAAYDAMAGADADNLASATRNFVTANLAEQSRLGLPVEMQQPIPKTMAAELAARFYRGSDQGGQGAAELVQGMAAQYGDRWPKVYAQMSKDLPPSANVIANMPDPAQRPAAEFLSSIEQQGGTKALEKAIPAEEQKAVKEALTGELADAFATFASQNGVGSYNALYDGSYTLALGYMTQGYSATQAATKAAADTFNSRYAMAGTYRVPRSRNVEQVTAAAERILFDGALPEMMDLPEGLDHAAYRDSLVSNGHWVTAGDESGLVLVNRGGYAVTQGGKPIVWSWDQLEALTIDKGPYIPTAGDHARPMAWPTGQVP